MSESVTRTDPRSTADLAEFVPAPLDGPGFRHRVLIVLRGEWPECPSCGVTFDDVQRLRVLNDRPVVCTTCGISSRPRAGTVLEGSTLTYGQFWIMYHLLAMGIQPEKIATLLSLSRGGVYEWRKRLQGVLI